MRLRILWIQRCFKLVKAAAKSNRMADEDRDAMTLASTSPAPNSRTFVSIRRPRTKPRCWPGYLFCATLMLVPSVMTLDDVGIIVSGLVSAERTATNASSRT